MNLKKKNGGMGHNGVYLKKQTNLNVPRKPARLIADILELTGKQNYLPVSKTIYRFLENY